MSETYTKEGAMLDSLHRIEELLGVILEKLPEPQKPENCFTCPKCGEHTNHCSKCQERNRYETR